MPSEMRPSSTNRITTPVEGASRAVGREPDIVPGPHGTGHRVGGGVCAASGGRQGVRYSPARPQLSHHCPSLRP